MAQKKITDLQLRSAMSETCQFVVDDSIQSYRITGAQLLAWLSLNTGGGAGGSFVWQIPDANGPMEAIASGVPVLDFSEQDVQEILAFIRVPDGYAAGSQIVLTGLLTICSVTSGKIFFKATTYLLREGTDAIGPTDPSSNSHASTNSEITVSGTANRPTEVGDVDLTDAVGEINSVAVQPGDYLAIKLIRDTANESSPAAASARLLRFSAVPKFYN